MIGSLVPHPFALMPVVWLLVFSFAFTGRPRVWWVVCAALLAVDITLASEVVVPHAGAEAVLAFAFGPLLIAIGTAYVLWALIRGHVLRRRHTVTIACVTAGNAIAELLLDHDPVVIVAWAIPLGLLLVVLLTYRTRAWWLAGGLVLAVDLFLALGLLFSHFGLLEGLVALFLGSPLVGFIGLIGFTFLLVGARAHLAHLRQRARRRAAQAEPAAAP
jgi:hypothetical protein